MTSDRWKDVERLYFAALERETSERPAFLREACPADEDLRREVESLLHCEPLARDFMKADDSQRLPNLVRQQGWEPGRHVGSNFGPYRLEALIASGGAGEVYRALDTRVDRTVAVKVLHSRYSVDDRWRDLLRREARVISSLNHPHICALFDVGAHENTEFLVMEFVAGETLRQRLARGRLPLQLAAEYAIQIIDALKLAHGAGFVHRDLKPENVMVTGQGVKILDFGLAARAGIGTDGAKKDQPPPPDGSALFGTPGYCAPEQLEGKRVDARTDIFSFGVVLHEMITGERAFSASTPVRLVGATLYEMPRDVRDVDPRIPPAFARIVERCLAKDPENRWQSTNDLLFALRSFGAPATAADPKQNTRRLSPNFWWAAGLLSVGVFLLARGWRLSGPRSADASHPPEIRFKVFPPKGAEFFSGYDVPFALSPDGRRLAYVAINGEGVRQLWVRSLTSDTEDTKVLRGTVGAQSPFWSPDGEWIGFFAANSLKKIRVAQESVQIITAPTATKGGASWNSKDVILFAPVNSEKISRVSAQGGEVTSLRIDDNQTGSQFWPQFLSDGEHFLYASAAAREIRIGSLQTNSSKSLMKFPLRISSVVYCAGYVFYVQDRTLHARPFDEQSLAFMGEAKPIAENIPVTPPGQAAFSVSASGVLAYWPHPGGTLAALDWLDRAGRATPAIARPAQYVGLSLSPDASQVAFSRRTRDGGADLWVHDFSSGAERQLTFDKAAFAPHWAPGGTRLVFSGPGLGPPPKLFLIDRNGSGAGTPANSSAVPTFGSSWSPDETAVVMVRFDPVHRNDLWRLTLADGAATPLAVNTLANESEGVVSPDGHWLAYVTDQSGRDEVWIARFPGGDERRPVSRGGGASPRWRMDGRELFFLSREKQLVAAPVRLSVTGAQIGPPAALFTVPALVDVDYHIFPAAGTYDPSPDGRRFLFSQRRADPETPPIRLITNWRALTEK
jgi:eukaryotic-like serine/threonine-protein kinase